MIDQGQDLDSSYADQSNTNQMPSSESKIYTENEVQRKMNEIAGKVRNEERQAAQRELASQMQAPQHVPYSGMTPEQIRQVASEEAQAALYQHQRNLMGEQMANKFKSEMQYAYEKYPGLQKAAEPYAKEDWRNYYELAALADGIDNVPDVMKHLLMDHPQKITSLSVDFHKNPEVALRQIRALSESMKANDSAVRNATFTPDPLSQIKPSNANVDNGRKTVADFRNDPLYSGN